MLFDAQVDKMGHHLGITHLVFSYQEVSATNNPSNETTKHRPPRLIREIRLTPYRALQRVKCSRSLSPTRLNALVVRGERASLVADDDIRAIRQVLSRFVEAWNARDADAFANLYTDPHVDVNHIPPIEARVETVAALRTRFANPTPRLSVTSDEVLVFGDWAAQRGAIALSGDDGTQNLLYIEVLRREKDGQWRVHWGLDAPLRGDAFHK